MTVKLHFNKHKMTMLIN